MELIRLEGPKLLGERHFIFMLLLAYIFAGFKTYYYIIFSALSIVHRVGLGYPTPRYGDCFLYLGSG